MKAEDGVAILPLAGMELTLEGDLHHRRDGGGRRGLFGQRHIPDGRGHGTRRGGVGMSCGPKKANLFLIELVCNLLIFALCAAVCVGLLVHARRISRESTRLTQAVYLAQSIAEEWKATGKEPARRSEDDSGLSALCGIRGNELDIAIYQDDVRIYALEGVTYLG